MSHTINDTRKIIATTIFVIVILFIVGEKSYAQTNPEMPPRPLAVSVNQHLSFGTFSPGLSGGTVVITANGIRQSTGSVVLLSGTPFPHEAIFEVQQNPGYQIVISYASSINLIGSNGGTINLQIGPTDKGFSFTTQTGAPFWNPVRVGGTLTIGTIATNPAGNYNGQFDVTFIQQ